MTWLDREHWPYDGTPLPEEYERFAREDLVWYDPERYEGYADAKRYELIPDDKSRVPDADNRGMDGFGDSVAISGGVAVVGQEGSRYSPYSSSIYVFERNSDGTWSQARKFTNGVDHSRLGESVAVSGDTVIAGAPGQDSAYIYEKSAGGIWTQVRKFTGATLTDFGASVAISGSRAVVSAPTTENSVYIYVRNAAGEWTLEQKITVGDEHFVESVGISGDRIVVGSTSNKSSNEGVAHIYERSADGTWSRSQTLTSENEEQDFGFRVGISGDRVVVVTGVVGDYDGYIFERNAAGRYVKVSTRGFEDGHRTVSDAGISAGKIVRVTTFGLVMVTSRDRVYAEDSHLSDIPPWYRTLWSLHVRDLNLADRMRTKYKVSAAAISGDRVIAGFRRGLLSGPDERGEYHQGIDRRVFVYDLSETGTVSTTPRVNEEGPETETEPTAPGDSPEEGGEEPPAGGTTGGPISGEEAEGPAARPSISSYEGSSGVQKITSGNAVDGDYLGWSVSVSGERAIAASGGPWGEPAAVYIYEKDSSGRWAEVKKLVSADDRYFGWSVAISGSRAIVGTDRDAAYVYERGSDGAWTLAQKLAEDGVTSEFGHRVSISGDRALVSYYDHAAYIYDRSADGEWMMVQKLPRVDALADYHFGWSAAVSGDVAVVSAPTTGEDGQRPGVVHVYERGSDGVWSSTARLLTDDATGSDGFGWSVAVSGSRLVVGAPEAGAAYVYEKNSSGEWTRTQKLTGSELGYRYGWEVSISGDRIVAGTLDRSAYVYERGSDGAWSQILVFKLSDAAYNRREEVVGVSISGDTALIGVGGYDTPGSVYIYEVVSGVAGPGPGPEEGPVARVSETVRLTGSSKLTASDRAGGDWFGISVSVSGTRAIVGASVNATESRKSGSVYVMEKGSDGAWSQTRLAASDVAFNDAFGRSVSISGARAIAGSAGDDDDGINSGSAYVFERGSDGAWSQTKLTASDGAAGDLFGISVSVSGSRVVVGAARDNDNGDNSGSAYVFERGSDGAWSQTKLTASDGAAGDLFGSGVSVSGSRVVVGAARDDDNGNNSGSAYVFERGSDGAWSQTKLTASDGAAGDLFGSGVSVSGSRVVVGAARDGDNGIRAGAAYVFERASDGTWSQTAKLTASDGAAEDTFGENVSVSGNRIIVGVQLNDDSGENSGAAYVFERNSDGTWSETTKLLAEDGAAGDEFGISVGISGGVAFIGAVGDDNAAGSAYVYEFSADGPGSESDGGPGSVNDPLQNPRAEAVLTLDGTRSLGEADGGPSSGSGGCAVSGGSLGNGGAIAAALAPLMLIPLLTCGFRRKKRVGD